MADIDIFRHAPVLQLLTGHFHERSGYRVHRPSGVGDWLLIHTVSGGGRFGHATGELISRPGDWVLLRPGTLHDYAVAPLCDSWELVWAHFQPRPSWLPWLVWPDVASGLLLLQLPQPIFDQRLLEVHRLLNSDLRRREDFAMNALELVLLDCDRTNPEVISSHHDERVLRAIAFLERNFASRITLDNVASAVGLSGSRLAHLFRSETGQTVQVHLEGCRMRRATELLSRTGFSVKQIAATVGYDSPFYFSQRFKRWTRKNPSAYREVSKTEAERGK